ncbi:MAG: WD40 repeat domain-containing protein [Planctomycetes bacterium]|nr:WD40 repeat domain-containing protein [Planctomycetota bacterium]
MVHVVDPETLSTRHSWSVGDPIRAVAVSPDERTVLIATNGGHLEQRRLHTWERVDSRELSELQQVYRADRARPKVLRVSWHPNGRWVIVEFYNRNALVVDLAGRSRILFEVPDHRASFSPDGGMISANTVDERKDFVTLWATESWTILERLPRPHLSMPGSPVWSPDGRRFAVGSLDRGYFWNLDADGDPIPTMAKADPSSPHSGEDVIAWSPDGTIVAGGGRSGVIRLWDPNTGRELRRFAGQQREYCFIAWARDARRFATTSFEGSLRIWDRSTAPPLVDLPVSAFGQEGSHLQWAMDSKRLAVGAGSRRVFDVETGQALDVVLPTTPTSARADDDRIFGGRTSTSIRTLTIDGVPLSEVAIPDSTPSDPTPRPRKRIFDLAWAGTDLGVIALMTDASRFGQDVAELWRVPDSSSIPVLLAEHIPYVYALAADARNGRAYVKTSETLLGFDARTGERFGEWACPGRTFEMSVSKDGRWIAVALERRSIEIRDTTTGDLLHTLEGHVNMCATAAFHPDGARLASGSRDRTTRLWDPESGRLITTFNEGAPVLHVSWSPDGKRLASYLANGIVRVRTALDDASRRARKNR